MLALAREAIRAYLEEGRRLQPVRDFPTVAPHFRGAFVTLKTEEGDLRGCVGTVLPVGPLDATIARMAVSAAVEDPRFPPVGARDLPRIRLEISALTVPLPVAGWDSIEIGRHGLIVSRGYRKGLLLPQVVVEWDWDREEFLRQTCLKAGLPPGVWREPGTVVEKFEAEVWGEKS